MKTTKKLIAIICVLLICISLFTTVANAAYDSLTLLELKKGPDNHPRVVAALQRMLNFTIGAGLKVDGIFGNKTEAAVKQFQRINNLRITGTVNKKTWYKLFNLCTVRYGSRNDMVKVVQEILNAMAFNCGKADGIFGKNTRTAVIAFQDSCDLDPDGIVGKETWTMLMKCYMWCF